MKAKFKITRVLKPSIVLEMEGVTAEEAMARAAAAGKHLLDQAKVSVDIPVSLQAYLDELGFKGWVPEYIIQEVKE